MSSEKRDALHNTIIISDWSKEDFECELSS